MGFSTKVGAMLARLPDGVELGTTRASQHVMKQVVMAREDITTTDELINKIKAREQEARNGSDS